MERRKQLLSFEEENLKMEVELEKAKARERVYSAEVKRETADGMNEYFNTHVDPDVTSAADDRVDQPFDDVTTEVGLDPKISARGPTSTLRSRNVKANVNVTDQPRRNPTQAHTLNVGAPVFAPTSHQPYMSQPTAPVDNVNPMSTLLSTLALPRPEVPKFNGDITSYRSFIAAFDSRIASLASLDADRLYYLEQHLVGEPKNLIEGCLYMEATEGYTKARQLLEMEYGDLYKLSMVYIGNIHEVQNHKSAVIPSMKNRVEAQINYELENGNYIKAEEKSPEL